MDSTVEYRHWFRRFRHAVFRIGFGDAYAGPFVQLSSALQMHDWQAKNDVSRRADQLQIIARLDELQRNDEDLMEALRAFFFFSVVRGHVRSNHVFFSEVNRVRRSASFSEYYNGYENRHENEDEDEDEEDEEEEVNVSPWRPRNQISRATSSPNISITMNNNF
jgi:hypothetical protein